MLFFNYRSRCSQYEYDKRFKKSFFLEKKVARYRCGESAIMTKGLKLIMFTCVWEKCVKSVEK